MELPGKKSATVCEDSVEEAITQLVARRLAFGPVSRHGSVSLWRQSSGNTSERCKKIVSEDVVGPANIGCWALYIFISVGIALLARSALFERWREASGDQSAFVLAVPYQRYLPPPAGLKSTRPKAFAPLRLPLSLSLVCGNFVSVVTANRWQQKQIDPNCQSLASL